MILTVTRQMQLNEPRNFSEHSYGPLPVSRCVASLAAAGSWARLVSCVASLDDNGGTDDVATLRSTSVLHGAHMIVDGGSMTASRV